MSFLDESEAQQERAAEEARLAKLLAAQHRRDVQELMALPSMQRLLARFLEDAGEGVSPFRTDALVMAHAAGWQDAALWWLARIRAHCPEREAQVRKALREAARGASQDTDDGPE